MKKTLPKFLKQHYPFNQNYVRLDSGPCMHYVDEGTGEVVLFLHGLPTWSFFFRNLILLLRSEFRCIAIDHIGYGLSDKPHKYQYDIKTHISNAINFAENMKFKKFHIVAHDFGVAVALAMAERWPERISSMALLNSSVFQLKRMPSPIMFFKFPIFSFLFARIFNCFCRICMHIGATNVLESGVINGYLWPYEKISDRVAIVAGINDIPWLNDHPSLETLDIICQKAFLLCNKKIKFFWAENDFRYNLDVLKSWNDILPNADCKTYEMAGHYIFEDYPEVLTDIRSFINRAKNIDKDLFKQPVIPNKNENMIN